MKSFSNILLPLSFIVSLFFSACDGQQTGASGDGDQLSDVPDHADLLTYDEIPGLTQATIKFGDKIEEQGYFFNGLKTGTWTIYHPNYFIKSIATYVNGMQHGLYVEMDNKGRLIKKANFLNGLEDGVTIYYDNSKVSEKRTYFLGQLNGTKTKYYTNGEKMEESIWKNGKMHGTALWYDQQGVVNIAYEYIDGELVEE